MQHHKRQEQREEEAARSPGERIGRANEAGSILDGPVFRDAMEAAESAFITEWLEAEDVTTREMCRAKVAVLEEVRRQLSLTVKRGEYAALAKPGS